MASGPSMCQADADLVREWRDGKARFAVAINNTYQFAPWADVVYACDFRWWERYHADVPANCERWAYAEECRQFGCNIFQPQKTGGNSGYQGTRLTITEFGANRDILLGFDMGGPGHWHPEHGNGWPNPTAGNMKQWREHLRRMGLEFPEVEIINATRQTALECFPRMTIEEALSADVRHPDLRQPRVLHSES